jgi:cystathionine beta-lyase/cystathionine gamma-synthase
MIVTDPPKLQTASVDVKLITLIDNTAATEINLSTLPAGRHNSGAQI